nr:MAG TPA: hypothetical protein [Bacteriophage sp.]
MYRNDLLCSKAEVVRDMLSILTLNLRNLLL